jgi:diguanylate cyclase (GGDEF)-like protein/PAS domain S-box-containing protein
MLLPATVQLFLQGTSLAIAEGFLISLFMIMLLATHSVAHKIFLSGFIGSIEKEFLAEEKVHALNKLRASEQRMRDVTFSLAEGVVILDVNGNVDYINPEAERLLGWENYDLAGKSISELMNCEGSDGKVLKNCAILQVLDDGKRFDVEDEVFRRRDGAMIPVRYTAAPLTGHDGFSGVVVSFHDISDRKRILKDLEHKATHDGLTDIYNRSTIDKLLNYELGRTLRYKRSLSLLMMDLDHFKDVNDTYGHQVGDDVLIWFARHIASASRGTDFVGRYGGEEFTMIMPETELLQANRTAERLCNMIANSPVMLGSDEKLEITVSIGVAACPNNAKNAEELIKSADDALYRAKELGRNCVYTAGQESSDSET